MRESEQCSLRKSCSVVTSPTASIHTIPNATLSPLTTCPSSQQEGVAFSLLPDPSQPGASPFIPCFSEREAILLSNAILVFTRPPASLRRRGEPWAPRHPTLTPQALWTEVIYCVSFQGAGVCGGGADGSGDAGVAEGLFVYLFLFWCQRCAIWAC